MDQCSNMSYLTKSKFKLGWKCPGKLFYYEHPGQYANALLEDQFMQSLADGGYQVGELARWMLCKDPSADCIRTLGRKDALAETNDRLIGRDASVAEAAFLFDGLFVRADVVVKSGSSLHLYEVKSTSYEAGESFWIDRGGRRVRKEWEEYLVDVAFQKFVVQKAWPGLTVHASLVMLDKGKQASIDGLNQMFPVVRVDGRPVVLPRIAGRESLGRDVLAYVNVDRDIEDIYALPFALPDGSEGSFEDLIFQLADIRASGRPFFCGVGSKCKGCEFRMPSDSIQAEAMRADGLGSGLDACWAHAVGRDYDPQRPKVIEVWNYRRADEDIARGTYFADQLGEADLGHGKRAERQWLQVDKVRRRDPSPWMDRDGLAGAMAGWNYPLHFIDFETARTALPNWRGMPPYTQVAFQFSHHTVDRDGAVRHEGQWIEARPGIFPDFAFVRELRRQLSQDEGTTFRYAAHENTVLRDIARRLAESNEPDRDELASWIATITESRPEGASTGGKLAGYRNMVDMKALVVNHHYDPATRGSNSLKAVLPAIIASSPTLRNRYGRPIGLCGIHSLNYPADWVWVKPACANDPYAALPPVFTEPDEKRLSDYVQGLQDVDDGGAATIAYAKLQFFELPDHERDAICSALLRYCELDTLAMVMLYEYWRSSV